MKKILILTLTLLLPLAVFARGNKPLSKWQQNLQKRNEQTVNHLLMLGHTYNHTNDLEIIEQLSKGIEMEIDHWYMENMQTITQAEQEKAMKEGKDLGDVYSEEYINKKKQELAAEVKAGKIPEIMLTTVSPKFAEQIKQRMGIQMDKQMLPPNLTQKQKGKTFNPFKK